MEQTVQTGIFPEGINEREQVGLAASSPAAQSVADQLATLFQCPDEELAGLARRERLLRADPLMSSAFL